VKTTLEIPDDLLRKAKAQAAARGISLKQLFTEALAERVDRVRRSSRDPAWRKLSGSLRSLRAETSRIQARIDDEFEQLDEDTV
jgi:hypothetical protein